MAIKVRMVLLTLLVLGSCRAQAPEIEKPETEKHGWKLVFVNYNDGDTSATAKDSRFYGLPEFAVFVKDYPFEAGKESPKILATALEYAEYGSSLLPSQRGIALMEFDCGKRLVRQLRTFKADGSETTPELPGPHGWDDIPKGNPGGEALLKYACRDRSKDKK